MINLLKFIIFGHIHKWETVGQSRWEHSASVSSGPRFVCRCEKCGAYRVFDL